MRSSRWRSDAARRSACEPGVDWLGRLSFEAILNRDYPVLMAIFTLSALLTLVGILLSDLSYALVDPRISFEGK